MQVEWLRSKHRSGLEDAAATSAAAAAAAPAGARSVKAYVHIYEELLGHGFSAAQVQSALSSKPQGRATLEGCLDWLCLSLPPSELPQRFVGSGRVVASGQLVPPPAEEPKKRNAFDLMKASNLKAASQAKQLKKAKHAAAAPAAPAQAPEHPPHKDVPPATPTATPAADGLTIDATPIATSVKKRPPSSEAQKSWIKTFPFIFIATAVNLATNGAVLVGCSVCREIYGANSNKSYAAGNASVYSLNDLTKHSKCDEHKDAVDAKVKKDGGSGGIVAAAHAGARAHVEVLKGLLPTLLMGALWICTELLPGLKFASLLVALTKAGNTSAPPPAKVKFFKGNFKMTTAYKFAADFADAAMESLKESFFDDDPSLDILACFTIVDPVQYIGMGHAELDDFGNDSFQQLKGHFWSGDGLPNSPFSARGKSFMATLDTEFKHVKTVIKDRLALTPSATMLNLWRFIARSSDSVMVPNIILLMNVYYVMALHTAEVERGFSIHRILKNRLRSRLMILMLDSLLRIWHLAQSFTGPRESENNSLINEAAEKLSGASLQSQGVKVLSAADESRRQEQQQQQQQAAGARNDARSDSSSEDGPGSSGSGCGAGVADSTAQRGAAERDDRPDMKSWILQYAEGSCSESGSCNAGEIDDWELWADPREVQRKRGERARAKVPPEVRRRQVAEEFVRVKEFAAQAKAAGNKPKQKEAGGMIRELKQEMERMGLSETVAAAIAGEAAAKAAEAEAAKRIAERAATAPGAAGAAGAAAAGASDDGGGHAGGGVGGFDGIGSVGSGSMGDGAAVVAAPVTAPDDDWSPGLDLFDSDLSTLATAAPDAAAASGAQAEPLMPWGATVGGGGGKAKKGAKAVPAKPVIEEKKPQALLNQHCQKTGWPQPRFTKLDSQGAPGPRYSASIDMGAAKGAGQRKSGLFGVHTYTAAGGPDQGWPNVQDAQGAACTRALWALLRHTQPDLYQHLPSAFRALWASWEAGAWGDNGGCGDGSEVTESEGVQEEEQPSEELLAAGHGVDSVEQEEWEDLMAPPDASVGAEEGTAAEVRGRSGADTTQLSAAMVASQERWQALAQRGQQQQGAGGRGGGRGGGDAAASAAAIAGSRARLPIAKIRGELLSTLAAGDVVVVCGDTGCGKTTQVPQYLLEEATSPGVGGACSVVCTQPRRIAAISVSERVAQERGEPGPGKPGGFVGYHVRLDAAAHRDTRLLFCTTGILLRRLAGDPLLMSASHVIVDEVHERSVQSDFLIALLRDLVVKRRAAFPSQPLKLILMSATMDATRFSDYFGGCPVLTAEGRTFPVEQHFLEDVYERLQYKLDPESRAAHRQGSAAASAAQQMARSAAGGNAKAGAQLRAGWGDEQALADRPLNPWYDPDLYSHLGPAARRSLARVNEEVLDMDMLEALVVNIDETEPEGSILVFLPGMREITALLARLSAIRSFTRGGAWLLPLHSAVSPEEQRRAFKVPPPGVRKVVIATNIAETSLTIEDVVYVIDAGKHKERRYDAGRKLVLLQEDWVSRAGALQRKGRAGRVRPGKAFTAFTRQRFEERLRAFQVPEILRVPLEELVLQIHLMGLSPAGAFLARVLEPPTVKAVTAAISILEEVGALTDNEVLTPLGRHLAQLPVEPRLGKLLVLGALLGCAAPAVTIAASMSHKSPWISGLDSNGGGASAARRAASAVGAKGLAAGQASDHLLLVDAFEGWSAARVKSRGDSAKLARAQALHEGTLEQLADMRSQFGDMLADAGLIVRPRGDGKRQWLDDPSAAWNLQARRPEVVKAALVGALSPAVAAMDEGSASHEPPRWRTGTRESDIVSLHPSCAATGLPTARFPQPFVVFLEKVATARVFLRDVTPVSPMALLLFGGPLKVLHEEGAVLVDGWARVRAPAQTAVLVKKLRAALDSVLEAKVRGSGKPAAASAVERQLMETIGSMLAAAEHSST
ncbi:hypothetical protein FOA52_006270 [Chlamydomonas sp. UWO 241]|nr:hypothetical protein FOA52_006270 [Chlamydomonas sp. UWO 241]